MDRLTERTNMGIVGNNESVKNYPLYKVAEYDELDHGITGQCFEKLADYEDLDEQGLLLCLPCKDELINVLAKLVLNSNFGMCYMCTNSMKNVTLDGVNNGCDGNCKHEEFTTDDLIKKIIKEMQFKAERKLKEYQL